MGAGGARTTGAGTAGGGKTASSGDGGAAGRSPGVYVPDERLSTAPAIVYGAPRNQVPLPDRGRGVSPTSRNQ